MNRFGNHPVFCSEISMDEGLWAVVEPIMLKSLNTSSLLHFQFFSFRVLEKKWQPPVSPEPVIGFGG